MNARRFLPAAAILLPIAVFLALGARLPAGGEGFALDSTVADALAALAPVSSEEIHIDPILTVATLLLGGLTALAVLSLLTRRRLRAALFLCGAIGVAVLLCSIAKGIVERPPIEGPSSESSFPSGSATWCMATWVASLLLSDARERRMLAIGGGLFTAAYAAIIVWEEWHYASDVLAGWCLALAWALALWIGLGRPRARLLPARQRAHGVAAAYPSS